MYSPTPPAGVGARGLVDQGALQPWMTGATPQPPQPQPLGMQARSLVDEQRLPEWLRQQPDERPRPTVAGWLGASAAEEPAPSWVAPQLPNGQMGQMGQMGRSPMEAPVLGYPAAQSAMQPATPYVPSPQPAAGASWYAPPPAQPATDDVALPDWLHQQAGAPAGPAGPAAFSPSPPPFDSGARSLSMDAQNPSAFSGHIDVDPTVRTPKAPTWGGGQPGDDQAGAEPGWEEPGGWGDDAAGQPSDEQWDAPARRGPKPAPRGAPLAPDEMPSWLRGSASRSGGRAGPRGHGSAGRGRPQPAAPEDGWGDSAHGWDENDGAYRDDDAGWDGARGAPMSRDARDARDEWDSGQRRDHASPRPQRRDDWGDANASADYGGQPDQYSDRYGDQYDEWGDGQDGSQSGEPYQDAGYDDEPDNRRGYGRGPARDAGYEDDRGQGNGSSGGWSRFFSRDE